MVLVFPAAIPWFIFADMVGSQSRPGLSEFVIILVVTFPFLLAPIGTTILGAMALSDVRRAGGFLRGGILAFFDTLFFPVIAINALLFFLICLIVIGVMNKFLDSTWQHPVHYPLLISLIIGIISCAILNYRLLPYAWKRYKEMVADFPEDQPI
jgi:hypothetical protein